MGLFVFAPLFAEYFQEPVGNVMSSVPIVGELFSGPAFDRYFSSGDNPRDYDYSLHCVSDARCI